MELYENKQLFRDVIIASSNYYEMSPAIVEKDYFVTVILRRLKDVIPGILFKGGTSLSKCFQIIDRFSEDIDLTLDLSHFTQSNKRIANRKIISVCDELGFEIENRIDNIRHSHGNYNCYMIMYPAMFDSLNIRSHIKLEMVYLQKSYPDLLKPVTSMAGSYLDAIGQKEMADKYRLGPFDIKVQSLERTFVDKVFAICDYYLGDKPYRQSRHLYDVYKLMGAIDWKNLSDLVIEVRKERERNKSCLSAKPGISVSGILRKIIDEHYYQADYQGVTLLLLNSKDAYDEVIKSIEDISDSGVFG